MTTIAFYDDVFCPRGTTKAILSYATAITQHTNLNCVLYVNRSSKVFSKSLYKQQALSSLFPIQLVDDPSQLFSSRSPNHDFIYHITGGLTHRDLSLIQQSSLPILLHQVGFENYYEPSFFSKHPNSKSFYVSAWQSLFFTGGTAPFLSHIISTISTSDCQPTFIRNHLGIPDSAILLGRHGGLDTWNLPFVNEVVLQAVKTRPDLFFLFINTVPFANHPQLIFQPPTSSSIKVSNFIASCDAMIHARWEGETFGLACAEFLIQNKPIITWSESRERNHFLLADRSVITYNYSNDLLCLLLDIDHSYIESKAKLIPEFLVRYYSPEYVSRQFTSLLGL